MDGENILKLNPSPELTIFRVSWEVGIISIIY